ncbi:MAG: peptide ABC transporter substrate-binding protein, partial [Phycisphaerales bacterium]|nr:peptide ABC transporter substrate-binding protein [Phycisphaerales bacterium]
IACTTLAAVLISVYAFSAHEPRADFTYVNPSGIHTLDPARMSWTQDFRVALNLWEGLTTWDPATLAPIAGAAALPPQVSPDRLTYTFTIRSDARWSDGDPVTARDFVRGWRRATEPGTAADYSFLFTDHIAGAAEYVAWRNEAVTVLTTLEQLRGGRRITNEQAKALSGYEYTGGTGVPFADGITPPARDAGERAWDSFATELPDAGVDWGRIADAVFDHHAARMEDRFSQVGMSAVDERTLAVRLTRPCPYFLDLTAFPTFLPVHESVELLRESHRGAPITEQGLVVCDPQWTKPDYHRDGYPGLITNGAYRLADWTFKRRARLAANPYFHAAGEIKCRTVDMLEYDNVSASLMAYESGGVDFLTDLSVPYDHELFRLSQSGERPDFQRCVVLATYFFNFNCVSTEIAGRRNPFLDARVRKAFTLAVDRKTIVDHVRRRGDRVARSFVPPSAIPGYEPPQGLDRDVEQAKQFLVEAGYPHGADLGPIEVLYPPAQERVCQALARMWEDALGVHIELRALESKTFAEEKARHRFMIAWGNWYADYNDPTTFLDCLAAENGNNDSGYANPRYDALLADAAEQADPDARFATLRHAERLIVHDDCPLLPILHYAELIAVRPGVSGIHPNARLWFPFRYVSVQR